MADPEVFFYTSFKDIIKVIPYIKPLVNVEKNNIDPKNRKEIMDMVRGEYRLEFLSEQDYETKNTVIEKSLMLLNKSVLYRDLVQVDSGKGNPMGKADQLWYWTKSKKGQPRINRLSKQYNFSALYLFLLMVIMSSYTVFNKDNKYTPSLIKMSDNIDVKVQNNKVYLNNYRVDSSKLEEMLQTDSMKGKGILIRKHYEHFNVTLESIGKRGKEGKPKIYSFKRKSLNLDYLNEFANYVFSKENFTDFFYKRRNIFVDFIEMQQERAEDMFVDIELMENEIDKEKTVKNLDSFFYNSYYDKENQNHLDPVISSITFGVEVELNNGEYMDKIAYAIGQIAKYPYIVIELKNRNLRIIDELIRNKGKEKNPFFN
ncbi:hypothetical protein K2V03_002132 [Listeria innocua]|nr:hypothetical protein [Listeria innocua]EIU0523722.1 hypothetical protein [Listeria innocua]